MDCTAWEWRDKLLKCVLDEKLSAVEGASLCGDMVSEMEMGIGCKAVFIPQWDSFVSSREAAEQ